MNNIILIGRLTKDITCQYASNQKAYTQGTIAVQRDYKNANGEYDADFIDFTAFGSLAELMVKHFAKGDRIGISGKLQIDKYTDSNGVNRTSAKVVVKEIEFLQEKKPKATEQFPQAPQQEEFEVDEDDLPF